MNRKRFYGQSKCLSHCLILWSRLVLQIAIIDRSNAERSSKKYNYYKLSYKYSNDLIPPELIMSDLMIKK